MAELEEHILTLAGEALSDNLAEMADLEAKLLTTESEQGEILSQGFVVLLGLTGGRKGRIVLDMSGKTASAITLRLLGEEDAGSLAEESIRESLAEFGNIVAGHFVTRLNNQNPGLRLMLTPPSTFRGEGLRLMTPKVAAKTAYLETAVGKLRLSVGLEGGKLGGR